MALGLHPISFRAACRYIEEHHRYLKNSVSLCTMARRS
jgi:hypothetical protein